MLALAPSPAASGKPAADPLAEQLRVWMIEQCGLGGDASAKYADALVEKGVDHPSDLGGLEDTDWPSAIKELHLKKIKAAVAKGHFEVAGGVGLAC